MHLYQHKNKQDQVSDIQQRPLRLQGPVSDLQQRPVRHPRRIILKTDHVNETEQELRPINLDAIHSSSYMSDQIVNRNSVIANTTAVLDLDGRRDK